MKTRNIIFGALLSVLVSFALCPQLQAATDTPDPGAVPCTFCTADGDGALFNGGGSIGNSAFGWFSQSGTAPGDGNTSVGALALDLNGFDRNTAVGTAALFLSQGSDNTAVGTGALENNNTNGSTAVGSFALFGNQAAFGNTAVGQNALLFNDIDNMTLAIANTAVGNLALGFNNDGAVNTAMGFGALLANFNGNQNTAVGFGALALSVGASGVTAVGSLALNNFAGAVHANGQEDTAVGFRALAANQGAAAGMTEGNAAFGDGALGTYNGATLNDSGNTALGSQALANAVSGERNTAVGRRAIDALVNGNANTAVGNNTGGSYLGAESGNILIGTLCQGIAADNRTTRIADEQSSFPGFAATRCFIGGITGVDVGAGQPTVKCNANGQLGTISSSAQFKKDIASMGKTSEAIFSLRPVTFHYKNDPRNIPAFGLIAEEVAKVSPDLVVYDREGKVYSVRYDDVNVMLLNEFLKEHKKVEEQQASISQLKSEMQTMVAQIKEQAAQIQKVSAQLEVSKPAPQVVVKKP
jgi:Chaperone of endosialidase